MNILFNNLPFPEVLSRIKLIISPLAIQVFGYWTTFVNNPLQIPHGQERASRGS